MASLSELGTPGINFGILHPKMNNRWHARFHSDDGAPLDFCDAITRQLISFGKLVQTALPQFGIDIPESTHFVVEDDVTNLACVALQKLKDLESFTLILNLLDGNEGVLRTYTLKKCMISSIEHPPLDYAGAPQGRGNVTRIGFRNDQLHGNLIDEIKTDPIASAIFTALQALELKVDNRYDYGRGGALTKKVFISYSDLTVS